MAKNKNVIAEAGVALEGQADVKQIKKEVKDKTKDGVPVKLIGTVTKTQITKAVKDAVGDGVKVNLQVGTVSKDTNKVVTDITKSVVKSILKELSGGIIKGMFDEMKNLTSEQIENIKNAAVASSAGAASNIDKRHENHMEEINAKKEAQKEVAQFKHELSNSTFKIFGSAASMWKKSFKEVFSISNWKSPAYKYVKLDENGKEVETTEDDEEGKKVSTGRFENTKKVWKNLGVTILKKVAGFILTIIRKIIFGILNLGLTLFKTAISAGMSIILAPVKKIYQLVKGLFKNAIEQSQIIKSLHTMVITPLLLLIEFLAMPAIPIVAGLMKDLLEFIMSNKTTIMEIGEKVAQFLKTIFNFSKELDTPLLDNPIKGIFDIMAKIAKSITNYILEHKEALSKRIGEIFVSIMTYATNGIELGITIIKMLGEAVKLAMKSPEFMTLVYVFVDAINAIFDVIEDIMRTPEFRDALRDILSTIISRLLGFLGTFIETVWDTMVGGYEREKINSDKAYIDKQFATDVPFDQSYKDYINRAYDYIDFMSRVPLPFMSGAAEWGSNVIRDHIESNVNYYYGNTDTTIYTNGGYNNNSTNQLSQG